MQKVIYSFRKYLNREIMGWEDNFNVGNEILLATSSKGGEPNLNIVLSLGFVDNQLLVADSRMDTTIKNLKENDRVCYVGGYSKTRGRAKLFTSGEYFDLCVKRIANFKVKTAILVEMKEVIDLENVKKVR